VCNSGAASTSPLKRKRDGVPDDWEGAVACAVSVQVDEDGGFADEGEFWGTGRGVLDSASGPVYEDVGAHCQSQRGFGVGVGAVQVFVTQLVVYEGDGAVRCVLDVDVG